MRMMRIVSSLMTGENISIKLNPGNRWKPLTTKRALYLLIEPSVFSLIRNTHLQSIVLQLGGSVTRV